MSNKKRESTTPIFRQEDRNNLEMVRQIVLYRLKNDTQWDQFDYQWPSQYVSQYVEFQPQQMRYRFVQLASEVMWELIIQGVITPGMDANNIKLPFFRITDYGQKVLEAERFIPHDPTGYLDDLRNAAKTVIGQSTLTYVEEALNCFNAGCHIASVLLLGVAGESAFLNLCDIVEKSLKSPAEKKTLSKKSFVKEKHRWLTNKYQMIRKSIPKDALPESFDLTLSSLYDLIRRQRNEVGHPQSKPPDIDRERSFVFFKLFPSFISDIEAFAEYCKINGL